MSATSGLNLLAETLAKTGLASSASEALKMAENIRSTENRVSKNFDEQNNKIEEKLSKKTYQEEIDDLIEKTSPEKKDFHYMVSGYKQAEQKEEVEKPIEPKTKEVFHELDEVIEPQPVEVRPLPVREISPEPVQKIIVEEKIPEGVEIADPADDPFEEDVSMEQVNEVEEELEPIKEEMVNEPQVQEEVVKKPVTSIEIEPKTTNLAISNAIKDAKPVYTDSFDDDRMLKDVMDEQANEIYSNDKAQVYSPSEELTVNDVSELEDEPLSNEIIEETPEYDFVPVKNVEEPLRNSIEPAIQEKDAEEFIVPVSNEEEKPKEEPVGEERKKEFKNPIPEVNLMDHFKFG